MVGLGRAPATPVAPQPLAARLLLARLIRPRDSLALLTTVFAIISRPPHRETFEAREPNLSV
jgi:hypothetical protein